MGRALPGAAGLLLISLTAWPAAPDGFEVCPACRHGSVAEAVEAAPAGATIRVKPGTYREKPIVIAKPLSLVGEGMPVLEGQGGEDVIAIRGVAGARVEGFRIRGSGFSYLKELAGIKVENSRDCVLSGNTLEANAFGVYLAASRGCVVQGNRIRGVPGSEASTGNGIHAWQGSHYAIRGNDVADSRDGIYLEFVSDSEITGNTAHDNLRYGLHFMQSNRDAYSGNVFTRNGAGVAVMYSRKIAMTGNEFSQNRGAAAYGLLLKEIFDSEIAGNRFTGNTVGIHMEGSNRSVFERNLVSGNGWGLRIMGSCESNRFTGNDFTGNTFDVTTNSSYNENDFRRNYWSAYDGYDLDRDGVGDRPFRLVSLSSIILERVDSAYFLIRSPLFALLDAVERALPELIPERLEDREPLMIPIMTPSIGGAR